MHIFTPIDLKYTKLQKMAENVTPAACTHHNKFHLAKDINQERRGQKYEF